MARAVGVNQVYKQLFLVALQVGDECLAQSFFAGNNRQPQMHKCTNAQMHKTRESVSGRYKGLHSVTKFTFPFATSIHQLSQYLTKQSIS